MLCAFFPVLHHKTLFTVQVVNGILDGKAVATMIFLSTLRNYVNIYLKKCKNLYLTPPSFLVNRNDETWDKT